MAQRMNTALQRRTIERQLRSRGVDLSTVDLGALIDPTLRLPENIKNVEKAIRQQQSRTTQARGQAGARRATKREARRRHRRRPRWDRRIDESKQAEVVFRDPTPRQLRKWTRNPDRFDVTGVDTRRDPDSRTQAKNPAVARQRLRARLGREFSARIRDREQARELIQSESRAEQLAGRRYLDRVTEDLNKLGRKMEKVDKLAPEKLMKEDITIL